MAKYLVKQNLNHNKADYLVGSVVSDDLFGISVDGLGKEFSQLEHLLKVGALVPLSEAEVKEEPKEEMAPEEVIEEEKPKKKKEK